MASSRASALEAKAVAIERTLASKESSKSAFDAAVTCADLYMQALNISDNASEQKRLNTKLREVLTKAEKLKANQNGKSTQKTDQLHLINEHYPASTRRLETKEEIILLEGSKLNGFIFKPWKVAPDESEFTLDPEKGLYTEPVLSLSKDQQRSFAGWERGSDAIRRILMYRDGNLLPNEPIMNLPGRPDLVQDMASDCSVVASLCAGAARAEKGHTRILGTILHPYEFGSQQVKFSPNGKYVLRLYFNGCWRRVDIDDFLPTSNTSRVLHVVDRSHPGLLWPAFMEKAYLKVRGGYDFPGSNSGTDLAVFTGWIPQQVFLHDEDVDQGTLWDELLDAFEHGNVLLTIGTGKLSRREQKQLGLAAEHDYAILDLKYRDGIKEMLIKNPWSDGEVWKGAARRRPNPNHETEELGLHPPAEESVQMLPGTFWMDYNSIFHHFENMYINWNPGLFRQRQDIHFTWQVPQKSITPNICVHNPQFAVRPTGAGEIWLLLNRHFRTGDYTHANSGKNGFISLYLYDENGFQVLSTNNAKSKAPFVDSPNTLLRFDAKAGAAYTAVVISQDLPEGKHNFTLAAFSQSSLELSKTPSKYRQSVTRLSAWTRNTAGGNTDSPHYLQNPQFAIPITEDSTSIGLILRLTGDPDPEDEQPDIHVKLLVLYSPAQDRASRYTMQAHRIDNLRNRDIVASSGDYRRGSAVVETTLKPGAYTVICSTFEQSQLAKFSLDFYSSSSQQAILAPVPNENSGRLSILSNPAVFDAGTASLVSPLTVPRLTRARFVARAKLIPGARSPSASSLYRMSVIQGQGPYARIIATSSTDETTFSSIYTNLRISDIDLNPDLHAPGTGGLWLVLERPSQHVGESAANGIYLEVEMLCEERVQMGQWQAIGE